MVPGPTRTPLYDRPGGFGDQAAELWGIDKESAITRMVTQIRPLLTRKMGQPDDIAQVVATSSHHCRARSPPPSGPSTAAPCARSDPSANEKKTLDVLVLVPGQPMCTSIPPDPRMTRDLIPVPTGSPAGAAA